jgi:hypothetical protein
MKKGSERMIEMYCDQCGELIDENVNGGVRLRTANRELVCHLCPEHQEAIRNYLINFCKEEPPRETKPTLPNRRVR